MFLVTFREIDQFPILRISKRVRLGSPDTKTLLPTRGRCLADMRICALKLENLNASLN